MNVIIRTLGIQRNTFVDQFYELLSFFSGDFADLRHGFSIGRKKMAGNGTRSDENKGHDYLLTQTVRHRSLQGPIKINVSVSIAVSMSVHMESCTVYIHFLDFYCSHFHIRTNKSPL